MQCTYKPSLCQEKNEKKGGYSEMAATPVFALTAARPQGDERLMIAAARGSGCDDEDST
jgi:hypothetical protein